MESSSVVKTEAGLKPASLPSSNSSATSLILGVGTLLSIAFAGATQLFLSAPDQKPTQKFAYLIGPAIAQSLTAWAHWAYKRKAKRDFRAYIEKRMMDIDQQIANVPNKRSEEGKKRILKLEERRGYWEDLLDKNEFSYIDAD